MKPVLGVTGVAGLAFEGGACSLNPVSILGEAEEKEDWGMMRRWPPGVKGCCC